MYGVTLAVTDIPYEMIGKSMAMPEGMRHQAEHVYRFMMGGIHCFFVVSSHRGTATLLQADQLSVRDDGTLKIYSGAAESTKLVLEQIRALDWAGKVRCI